MTDSDFQVPVLFDYVATFTWAVSGAIVAIRRRFDITGVFIVSLLAAIGGGHPGSNERLRLRLWMVGSSPAMEQVGTPDDGRIFVPHSSAT